MSKEKSEGLGSRFRRETAAFIASVLRMKGLTNEAGQPIDVPGSKPITIEDGRLVYVTEGVEIDDDPTHPEINTAMIHDTDE